jgi:hypothetical protein
VVAATAEDDPPRVEPLDAQAADTTTTDPDYRTLYIEEHERSARRLRGWRAAERRAVRLHVFLRRRWAPTLGYAIRLASAVFHVPRRELDAVSWCESRRFTFATNGRYRGAFQLGWSPFGFSPFDPIASALSTAQTVRADGGWRQWSCKP